MPPTGTPDPPHGGAPYTAFAPYYDDVYERLVDYDGDVAFLREAFRRHAGVEVRRVLDLGCGTGAHAVRLAEAGLEVVGVDVSEALLAVAQRKMHARGVEDHVRLHHGDMAGPLPNGPFDAAISMFGAFNYLTDDADAARALAGARSRLAPGGILVFEFWNAMGVRPQRSWDRTETPDGRAIVRLLESNYDIATSEVRAAFQILVLRGDRVEAEFREEHGLRARLPADVRRLLLAAGFEPPVFTKGDREGKSFDPAPHDHFRVMAIARRA